MQVDSPEEGGMEEWELSLFITAHSGEHEAGRLTELGRQQATTLAHEIARELALKGISRPLILHVKYGRRAFPQRRETAEIIAAACGVNLREIGAFRTVEADETQIEFEYLDRMRGRRKAIILVTSSQYAVAILDRAALALLGDNPHHPPFLDDGQAFVLDLEDHVCRLLRPKRRPIF